MKRLTTFSLVSLMLAVTMAMPLDAQTRSNTRSKGTGTTKTTSQSSSSSSKSGASNMRNAGQQHSRTGSQQVQKQTQQKQTQQKQQSSKRQELPAQQKQQGNVRTGSQTGNRKGSSTVPPANAGKSQQGKNTHQGTVQPPRTGSNVPKNAGPGNDRGMKPGTKPGVQPGSKPGTKPGTKPGAGPGMPPGKAPAPAKINTHRGPDRMPPRHRDPIGFDRPSRFWDGGRHYFGYRVHYLPDRYVRRVYWGIPYYVLDDIYYRYDGRAYYICRPPFGVPFNPVVADMAYSLCRFAYYADAYYVFRTINKNAELITRQNAIIAANNATIASQNATIALNTAKADASMRAADRLGLVQSYASASTDYYYDDGVFFTKDSSGQYVTIVPPAGALVDELPEDYEVITLDGNEYYAVDDTIYRTVVIDGSLYFEVLGQRTA